MEWQVVVEPIYPYLILVAGLVAGYLIGVVIARLLRLLLKGFTFPAADVYRTRVRRPVRLLVTILAGRIILGAAGIPEEQVQRLLLATRVLVIADVTWLILGLLHLVESYARNRFTLDAEDNLHARKLFTQLGILRRISAFIVIVLSLGVILTTFDEIQQVGTTLLASAGVVGIILGVAAQKTIGMVLAGLQVALTQPVRIDDVLIVEGEWGRVEEIALTYVVVKIWDERRLVVPISYFIEKPFQNWTRSSSRLIGTVYLYADYTLPADPLREELKRILPEFREWDGRVAVVQVTGTSEQTQEIRILVSANDSPLLFDLRCKVREALVAFIRRNYPESLPRLRTELPEARDSAHG